MAKPMQPYLVVVEQAIQLPMRSKKDMVAKDFTVMAHSRTQAVTAVRKAGYSRIIKVSKEEPKAPRLSR